MLRWLERRFRFDHLTDVELLFLVEGLRGPPARVDPGAGFGELVRGDLPGPASLVVGTKPAVA